MTMPAAAPTSTAFLVESYSPEPAREVERLLEVAGRPHTSHAWLGPGVGYRGSIAIETDELALHLFEAQDADTLVIACRAVGIRCDRIVPMVAFGELADRG